MLSQYYLSVPRAVTRLTVYRPLQVEKHTFMRSLPKVIRNGPPCIRRDYRPIHELGAVFLSFLDFSRISTCFSDFSGLNIDNAEAHARGFASL